ncbi:MAG: flagellar hook protein FlgE [Oscillospiraceae bacterium]
MVRSLYSGVAGLTAHQTRMDVIGNNIANVNTYGFKASRTSFSDIYYQAKKSATGGSATFAGNNESAVGYGVEVSSIDKDMSASSFQTTNRTLDLAISGDGFFITGTVTSLGNVESVNYTRYGGFGVDSEGNLVNTLNRFVLGTVNDGDYSSILMDAKIPAENASDLDIINVNDLVWDAFKDYTQIDFVDVPEKYRTTDATAGTTQTLFTGVDPTDTTNQIAYDRDTSGNTVRTDDDLAIPTDTPTEVAADYIIYNVNGKYINTQGVEFDPDTGYYLDENGNYYSFTATTTKDENGDVLKTYQYTLQEVDENGRPTGTATDQVYTYNSTNKTFESTDERGNTIYADMKVRSLAYSDLEGFSVGSDGVLTATYASQIKKLARIEIATFDNVEGLEQLGETAFGESSASGKANIKAPGSSGAGKVASSKLEMSNVNLASEFSDMIVTQRGFQANARIITTSDSMLEELVNLKR